MFKIIHCLFLLFFVINNLISQDNYYYVKGKSVILQPLSDKIVIKIDNRIKKENINKILAEININIISETSTSDLYKAKISNNDKHENIIEKLKNIKGVEFIHNVFRSQNGFEICLNNQFIVSLKSTILSESFDKMNNIYCVKILDKFKMPGNIYLLEIPWNSKYNSLELSNIYYESGFFEFSKPNFEISIKPADVPNDQNYPNQWALTKIHASDAWNYSQGSSSVKIAIIDNGVHLTHEDLVNNIIQGADFSNQGDYSPQPKQYDRHGACCAGIAAAVTNNNIGISGIARNCRIMPIQIAFISGDGEWITNSQRITSGINYAVDPNGDGNTNDGADVLSCSWYHDPSEDYEGAINGALVNGRGGKGCVVVAAAGNRNLNSIDYPAKYSGVIAVGATNESDERCTPNDWGSGAGSNYGPELSVTAPGNNIYSTTYNSSELYVSNFYGTSAACPHVSGLAALIISQNPLLTQSQVRKIIEYSADDLGLSGKDDYYGWGRLNAYNALRITTSGALPGNEVWRNTVNLSNNITVPSGVNLTILDGTIINFNGYKIVSTGGTFNLLGTYNNDNCFKLRASGIIGLYPNIQTAINDCQSGQTVILTGNHQLSSDINISNGKYLEISDANIIFSSVNTKISINNGKLFANNTTFQGNGSINSWFGIKFQECSGSPSSLVDYCTIKDASYGVSIYKVSSVAIRHSRIENCNYGTHYSVSSTGDIGPSCVFTGNSWDVYGDSTSTPYPGGAYYGYISFRNPGYYQVYSENTNATILACGNYWQYGPICTQNVDYSNQLFSDPNPKIEIKDDIRITETPLVLKKGSEYVSGNENGSRILDKGLSLFKGGKYIEAISEFDKVIDNNPNNLVSYTALSLPELCMENMGRENEILERTNSVSQKYYGKAISYYAESRKISRYIKAGNYNEAALNSIELLKSTTDTMLIKISLYDLGNLYWYHLNDRKKGESYYRDLIKRYPYSSLSDFALATLGEYKPKNGKDTKPVGESGKAIIELNIKNYPNPFNPSTKIEYSLPENTNVSIIIYNSLGQEIARLVDEYKEKGVYSITWNPNNISSGIY